MLVRIIENYMLRWYLVILNICWRLFYDFFVLCCKNFEIILCVNVGDNFVICFLEDVIYKLEV